MVSQEKNTSAALRVQPLGLASENRPGLLVRPGGISSVVRLERARQRKSIDMDCRISAHVA